MGWRNTIWKRNNKRGRIWVNNWLVEFFFSFFPSLPPFSPQHWTLTKNPSVYSECFSDYSFLCYSNLKMIWSHMIRHEIKMLCLSDLNETQGLLGPDKDFCPVVAQMLEEVLRKLRHIWCHRHWGNMAYMTYWMLHYLSVGVRYYQTHTINK